MSKKRRTREKRDPLPGHELYWFNGELREVDERIGKKRAIGFLEDGAPVLDYKMSGQEPCVFVEGERIIIERFRLWITISRVRAWKGMWRITYVLSDHRPALLGKKMGFTDNPSKALKASYVPPNDERHHELEGVKDIEVSPEKHRVEGFARRHKSKREGLIEEREAHRRRLNSTGSNVSKRLLPAMIEKLDRQIAALDDDEPSIAA